MIVEWLAVSPIIICVFCFLVWQNVRDLRRHAALERERMNMMGREWLRDTSLHDPCVMVTIQKDLDFIDRHMALAGQVDWSGRKARGGYKHQQWSTHPYHPDQDVLRSAFHAVYSGQDINGGVVSLFGQLFYVRKRGKTYTFTPTGIHE